MHEVRKALGRIMSMDSYIPCHCCTQNDDGICIKDPVSTFEIPSDIKHVGCGDGSYDDIPF